MMPVRLAVRALGCTKGRLLLPDRPVAPVARALGLGDPEGTFPGPVRWVSLMLGLIVPVVQVPATGTVTGSMSQDRGLDPGDDAE